MSLIFHGLKIPLFKVCLSQSTALYLSLSGSLSKERDCTISGANQPRIALIINAWINKRYNSLLLCSMANYSMVMLKLESLRPIQKQFLAFWLEQDRSSNYFILKNLAKLGNISDDSLGLKNELCFNKILLRQFRSRHFNFLPNKITQKLILVLQNRYKWWFRQFLDC